jgi:hypothetical protein
MKSKSFKLLIILSSTIGILLQGGLPLSLRYFTTLSNLVVILYYIFHLNKRNPRLKFLMTMSISLTGLVAHFMLKDLFKDAPTNQQLGLFFLHYMTPICVWIDYFVFDKKGTFKKEYAISATSFPILYVVFAFIAAPWLSYPYPFLNVDLLGIKMVIINIIGLSIAYIVGGYLFYFLDKKLK